MSEKFQVVVIGGGPGGYVCAIRLAQLGLKTACIESRGSLGGTCLNVGCIPSKSLLNLSEEFHKVQNLSSKGIEVGDVKLNLEKMMKSKDKAVTILTKGVEFLLKKNKVTYYKGTGSFKSQNEIIIKDDQNKETIIIGAGISGLYQLHKCRDELNLKTLVIEEGSDIGGTWYWNRYPGARCDSESHTYGYTFSEKIY
ncbi:FAD-dependent oxidoreductase, partial [bacterium]|nr:FAD-dependent oxidoreductase [bacterium]